MAMGSAVARAAAPSGSLNGSAASANCAAMAAISSMASISVMEPVHHGPPGRSRGAFGQAHSLPARLGIVLWRTSRNGRSRSGAGSRGSPSTRSLMMLRWISLVPLRIDVACRKR